MNIKECKIAIKEVSRGYINNNEKGVTGYDGKLDIRPQYQREFVYKDAQRDEVIRTIMRGLPLNVMYWSKSGDNSYEVLDGQQRTVSFCEYIAGSFSVDEKYFWNLPSDQRDIILNYQLFIYVCDGTSSEKLDWFRIINIAGEKLTEQELRNAVYAGSWVSDAKRYFSKSGAPAESLGQGNGYLKGSSIRQEFLETAISWISNRDNVSIEGYMARHQNDSSAIQLWNYYRSVIAWVEATFPTYYSEMRGVQWGLLFNRYGNRTDLDPKVLDAQVKQLFGDEDVTKKSGIFEYLLNGNERLLSIRSFDKRDAQAAYARQKGICPLCGRHFEFGQMQADHKIPWSQGGRTIPDNCEMLCTEDNIKKSNR